jgi:AcrR family transcriptional regulator
MSNAHKRKKQPEEVRRKLIECAVRIISEQGPGAVTVQAVADAAGVTKGGLLHHFSDKNKLTEAVSRFLLDQLDTEISKQMGLDLEDYGKFTRSYIKAISVDLECTQNEQWTALAIYSITQPESKSLWNEWINEKQKQYFDTDSDQILQILRYAADGIWFEAVMGAGDPSNKHSALLSNIIKMTYPDSSIQVSELKKRGT